MDQLEAAATQICAMKVIACRRNIVYFPTVKPITMLPALYMCTVGKETLFQHAQEAGVLCSLLCGGG